MRICPQGGALPTIVDAVEFLGEVATADPACAAEAASGVRYLLDTDDRPVRHGLLRAARNGEALLAAVRVVVGAADQRP
ncbi:hypothetical protein AB0E21_30310 [Streptomyces sp. NPDC047967]|uniref:hypothetical protein n=1 Tax=Streptomyces sp. NPDC047967 TaxID=3154924 RepID=UPI00340A724B